MYPGKNHKNWLVNEAVLKITGQVILIEWRVLIHKMFEFFINSTLFKKSQDLWACPPSHLCRQEQAQYSDKHQEFQGHE